MIFEIGVSHGASENAKGASERFTVNASIVDHSSEIEKKRISRGERVAELGGLRSC
jgi:hypothetical protein